MTEKHLINPWTWQEKFGFVHGVNVQNAGELLFISGQVPVNEAGVPCCIGDMAGQISKVFDNIETVLEQAGASLADVVRLTYYTTDVDALLTHWPLVAERLGKGLCKPASSMMGVTRLSAAAFMLEIEATAVL